MSDLTYQIPGTLSNPTTLPDDMKRSLTQLKSENNRSVGVIKQPARPGEALPRGGNRGEMGSRPTTRGVAVRVYADRGTSREVEIPEDAVLLLGPQSGTAAPTTDDFAENEYGWFYNTATSTAYFVINLAGTITNISPASLGIAFTNISGSITADQHGALGRVDSATNPLHTNATTAQAGFFAATDKAKLDAATDASIGSTLVMRDASSDIFCRRLHMNQVRDIADVQVLTTQQAAINNPLAGTNATAANCALRLTDVLGALRTHGIIAT